MNKESKINIGDTGNQHEDGNQPMGTPYEKDVVAWAEEQAALLRAGKLASIDIEHIAEEIEDVGKSEQREFASRMAVLLAHLLKWQLQPERRTNSWTNTVLTQRAAIERRLRKTPSLKPMLSDEDWIADMWGDARELAANETRIGFADFPESCPWPMSSVLEEGFLPE
ncbi:hypothetical protein AWB80_02692 [Caballeronia pedi]|uniref:DUF29 domain-containing protein n=2 Tax=Caballeronia pedi TaxID=1777141 RepID=A0A158AX58_9BURK|nr:hypothetical protein AWB80_02692 [Caballeronia pedi]